MSLALRYLILFVVITLLTIIPLPLWANQIRPTLVLMVWIYIRIFNPEHFKLFLLFINGLILDCLLYTVIGMHAFALSFVLWCITPRVCRFVFFNLIQQAILVFILSSVYSYIILIINLCLGNHLDLISPLLTGLCSALLWPWLKFTLDDVLNNPINTHA